MTTVLIVEDDPAIARSLTSCMRAAGYRAAIAVNAAQALTAIEADPPDVLVLDLLLPDAHGVEVCRRIREWSTVPLIVVSALGEDSDKVAALDAGADDYITKPFRAGELLARIRAALRRPGRVLNGTPTTPVSFGAVEIDLTRRTVRREGRVVEVTRREFDVLGALAREPGRVLTHRALLVRAWDDGEGSVGSLRFHIAALRRKLEEDPAQPAHLLTETGVGYRLVLEPW